MIIITLEGNRREVYAMGFDLMDARDERGEPVFGNIREIAEKSTFCEEAPLDSKGRLVFCTEKYDRKHI